MSMSNLAGLCVSVLVVLELAYIVYYNVVMVVCRSKHKCSKKRYCKPLNACHNSGCRYAKYCQDYEHIYTDEERMEIRGLLEEIIRKIRK